jgi:hypothetical protein
VTNWQQTWLLYNQAKAWSKTPAELLFIEDPMLAFSINNSVYSFGSALEHELDSITGKKKEQVQRKRQQKLSDWLGIPRQYRNPIGATRGKEA